VPDSLPIFEELENVENILPQPLKAREELLDCFPAKDLKRVVLDYSSTFVTYV
jgi:hypothetical protein